MAKTTRMRSPGDHRFGNGWILGKFQGRDSFNDGCAIFVGKPPKGDTCKIENESITAVLKKSLLKRLIPTRVVRTKDYMRTPVILLKGRVAIQKKYHDFLLKRFPDAKLYLGKKTEDGENRYVFGKDGSGIVALIMPISYK